MTLTDEQLHTLRVLLAAIEDGGPTWRAAVLAELPRAGVADPAAALHDLETAAHYG